MPCLQHIHKIHIEKSESFTPKWLVMLDPHKVCLLHYVFRTLDNFCWLVLPFVYFVCFIRYRWIYDTKRVLQRSSNWSDFYEFVCDTDTQTWINRTEATKQTVYSEPFMARLNRFLFPFRWIVFLFLAKNTKSCLAIVTNAFTVRLNEINLIQMAFSKKSMQKTRNPFLKEKLNGINLVAVLEHHCFLFSYRFWLLHTLNQSQLQEYMIHITKVNRKWFKK